MSEVEIKQCRMAYLIMRVMYIISATLTATAAILALVTVALTSPTIVFISFYIFVFSILICCFEFGTGFIAKLISVNFGFMYTVGGRIFFDLFVAGKIMHASLKQNKQIKQIKSKNLR